uniref:Immunoglobulin domain-containing protein n=1 Tax=Erpetoichthys calabaricus TaxID=27687 RepID=A0A8C4TGA7_ERPCA
MPKPISASIPDPLNIFPVCFFSTHCRKDWRVTQVPEKLSAVRGSCVVIPCMVYLPAKGVAASRITAIWRMADHGDVFNSRGAKVLSGFKGRTTLLGNVADQNCSLQIQNLRHEDNGSYYFRIEVKGLNNYSFINNMVTLQVTGKESLKGEGKKRERDRWTEVKEEEGWRSGEPIHWWMKAAGRRASQQEYMGVVGSGHSS